MNILLDTVAIYRAATHPEALPNFARTALEDPDNSIYVSLVSAWELTIKSSLGKLKLPAPIETFFAQITRDLLASTLGLDLIVLAKLSELPFHHNDPFDRLLIAQAVMTDCAVITSDQHFSPYGINVIW
jgi:PIN domain nuclease of toxin-antitoxin system